MIFDGWTDFDETFRMMNDLRRRLDASFGPSGVGIPAVPSRVALGKTTPSGGLLRGTGAGLIVNRTPTDHGDFQVFETEDAFILAADLPGVAREDIELEVEGGVLTLRAKREVEVPEGYSAVLSERASQDLTRRFELGTRVDTEGVIASLKDGVLEVQLPKHPETKPRQIPVEVA